MQYLTTKNISYGVSAALDIGLTAPAAVFLTTMNPVVGALFAPLHTVITFVALTAISKCVSQQTLDEHKTKIILGTSITAAALTAGIAIGTMALFGVAFSFASLAVMLLTLTVSALTFTAFHLIFKNSDVLEGTKAPEPSVVFVSRPEDSTDYYQQVYIVDEEDNLIQERKDRLERPERRRVIKTMAKLDPTPLQKEIKVGGEVIFAAVDPESIVVDEKEEELELPPLPAPIVYRRLKKQREVLEGNKKNIFYEDEDVRVRSADAQRIIAKLQGI